MSKQQQKRMIVDPATGRDTPYPSHAQQWREFYGTTAWLFDPWTGKRRDARGVGSDTFGLLIMPPGGAVVAAPETLVAEELRRDRERMCAPETPVTLSPSEERAASNAASRN